MKPYETPADRLRALYRIPTAPPPNRVLELCCGPERTLFVDGDWPGESRTVCLIGPQQTRATTAEVHTASIGQPWPFAPGSFDLVVLHKTLDDLHFAASNGGTALEPRAFLAQVGDLLTAGGLVAGCASNATGMNALLRRTGLRRVEVNKDDHAFLTASGCQSLLHSSGYHEIKTCVVLPSWNSPLRLVESEAQVARVAFRSELEATRPRISPFSYAVRRLVCELGLYRHLEDSLFFWGYKAC
jgi:SAM-dependent methyltransferase